MQDSPPSSVVLFAEQGQFVLTRAQREGRNVLLKTVAADFASADVRDRLHREYELNTRFDHPNLVHAVEFLAAGPRPVLVLNDEGGASLREMLALRLPLRRAIEIAIDVATALAELHARDVVHRGICPDAIVVGDDGKARIVDLGTAMVVPRQQAALMAPSTMEGALHYISPEQTGRTSRAVDYRSDLYSLGITLFEMIAGTVPLTSSTPLELVHDHLASRPVHLREIRPNVPVIVGDLVARLLEKDPDDRYSSALGVVRDLRNLLDALVRGIDPDTLQLTGANISTRFRFPDRLFGRDAEIATLTGWFEQAAGGRTTIAFVHGYSGVGKTSLVDELRGPVNRRRGYFVRGKFDQLDRGSAYRAVTGAFGDLVRQLLTEDESRVAAWRKELRLALGAGAGVLAELIPNLRVLLGELPDHGRLEASSERHRLNRLVALFLSTVAEPDRPLVILLDDLQWADTATLDFIERAIVDVPDDSLLIIGAYRDNEIDDAHPMRLLRQRLAANDIGFGDLALEPLADEAMSELVATSLGRRPQDAAPLTELCIRRTGSNPFFARLFLSSLFEDGLLQVDPSSGAWSWDMETLASRRLTDNMAELAMAKVDVVREPAQQLLSIMALVGVETETELLREICEEDPEPLLQELAAQELITLTGASGSDRWQFTHDRIQEAASLRMTDDARLRWHRRIGDALRRRLQPDDAATAIFSVLRHLNEVARVADTCDRDLAGLNLHGGRAAMRATAYDVALRYFTQGIALLGPEQWTTDSDLAFSLHFGAADAARLATRFEDMNSWLDIIQQSTPVAWNRVQATRLKVLYLAENTGDNVKAVAIARAAFAELGWKVGAKPSLIRVVMELLRTRWLLRRHSIDDLNNLPVMRSETPRSIMRLLNDTATSAYWVDQNLLALMILKGVRLSVTHGNDNASAYFFAAYGMVLSAIVGDPAKGLAYANLAVKLTARFGMDAQPSRVRFIRDTLVAPATTPLREIDARLEKAYTVGMEIGDMGFATGAFFFRGLHRLLYGLPLDDLEPDVDAAVSLLRKHVQVRNLNAALALRQFIHDVRHGAADGVPFTGPYVDADAHLRTADRMAAFWTHTFRAMSRFHAGDPAGAGDDLRAADSYLDAALGQALVPIYHLYGVLAACADPGSDRRARRAARRHCKRLRWYARCNPQEHEASLLLAEGALASAGGDAAAALARIERAIKLASERAVPLIAALAAAVAAQIHERAANEDEAARFRAREREAYRNWGATALAAAVSSPDSTEVAAPVEADVDLETVVRAAEAISEQIELHALLETLMSVTLQNAGADRGLLFRVEQNGLVAEAEGRAKSASSTVRVRVVGEDTEVDVADSVVRLVQRTLEPMIMERAVDDPMHGTDPWIQSGRVRSLMCLPLLNQGKLQGILYLENNQVDGAFTPARYRLLRLISAQAASALEKARLLDAQAKLIVAQNKFVPQQFLQALGHESLFQVELGEGRIREADILFTDIRGFTTIVENMTPNEAMEFLNEYLSHIEPFVHEFGGFIERYDGDAILALFDTANGSDAGIRAALAMAAAEKRDNERRRAAGLAPVHTGFGLNTGQVMLGVVGGETSMRASLIGDAVNLASRVETLTKRYTTRMLITESTANRLQKKTKATLRPLEWLQVAGKSQPTLVFEVLEALDAADYDARLAHLTDFLDAHRAYEVADFRAAMDGFAAVLAKDPADRAAKILSDRSAELLASGMSRDGPPITRLESK